MAWKRAFQPLAALAETRLVIRKRSMLVAFCPIPSDNGSYRCRTTNFGSTFDGSCNSICPSYTHKGAGNTDAGATDGGPRVTAERYQKEIGRAEKRGPIRSEKSLGSRERPKNGFAQKAVSVRQLQRDHRGSSRNPEASQVSKMWRRGVHDS